MKNIYIKLAICTVIGAVLALTSHIYISEWAKPLIEQTLKGFSPESSEYSTNIIIAAYGTSFIPVGIIVYVYYQAGHLLTISNQLLKSLVLTAIIFCIKGELIRQPIMDYLYNTSLGLQTPFAFVFFNYADRWVANILLAFFIVYFCPIKHEEKPMCAQS